MSTKNILIDPTLLMGAELKKAFTKIFNRVKRVAFDSTWTNGTGYFDNLAKSDIKEAIAFLDVGGRRVLAIPTFYGTLVLFERFSKGEGPIIAQVNQRYFRGPRARDVLTSTVADDHAFHITGTLLLVRFEKDDLETALDQVYAAVGGSTKQLVFEVQGTHQKVVFNGDGKKVDSIVTDTKLLFDAEQRDVFNTTVTGPILHQLMGVLALAVYHSKPE